MTSGVYRFGLVDSATHSAHSVRRSRRDVLDANRARPAGAVFTFVSFAEADEADERERSSEVDRAPKQRLHKLLFDIKIRSSFRLSAVSVRGDTFSVRGVL